MDFDPNSVFAQLSAQLDRIGKVATEELADATRENVSAGARTGIQHPGLPRRSSGPDEFSQEQSGGIKGRIGSWEEGGGHRAGIREATAQDFTQELGSATVAARANLQRTTADDGTIARVNEAVRRSAE